MVGETFWVDGVQGACVPPDDRGLGLADGVFETMRFAAGRIGWRQLHLQRLAKGLEVLGFTDPQQTAETVLLDAARRLEAAFGAVDGTLRLTVTRGSGPRGYAIPEGGALRTILRFNPGLTEHTVPARLIVSSINWSHQPHFAGCKLLARTEQVMALAQAQDRGFQEAVMCDFNGSWLSTASGNLFLRRGATLITPPLECSGISGTRRRAIIDHCAQAAGYDIQIRPVNEEDERHAEEALFCNAVVGVRSISAIDSRRFDNFEAAARLGPLVNGGSLQ